jgi:cytidylate kinase
MAVNKIIGIVGPCAAGKSTLVRNLAEHGIEARHIAQEHSYVQDMWRRVSNPDVLIYLDVSFDESIKRRSQNWTEWEYSEQVHRLHHAREHATIYIDTNQLSINDVFEKVVSLIM